MRSTSPTSILFALACGAMPWSAGSAAEPESGARSVPGTVVPSTGTTGTAKTPESAPTGRSTRPARPGAAVGSGGGDSAECAALRRRYAQSQACFAPYRLQNGGLKPEAFKHCKQLENPAVKCGSEVVD